MWMSLKVHLHWAKADSSLVFLLMLSVRIKLDFRSNMNERIATDGGYGYFM